MENPNIDDVKSYQRLAKEFGLDFNMNEATISLRQLELDYEKRKEKAKTGELVKEYEALFDYVLPDIKSNEDVGVWKYAVVHRETGELLELVKISKSVCSQKEAFELATHYALLQNRFSPIGVVNFLEKKGEICPNIVEVKSSEDVEKYYKQQPFFTIDGQITNMSSFLDYFYAIDEYYKRHKGEGVVSVFDISYLLFKDVFEKRFPENVRSEALKKFVGKELSKEESDMYERYLADWQGTPLINTLDDPNDILNIPRFWTNNQTELTRNLLQDYYLTCDFVREFKGDDRTYLKMCHPASLALYRFELINSTGRPDSDIWFNHLFEAYSRMDRQVTLAEWWDIQLTLRFLRNIKYYADPEQLSENEAFAKEMLEHPAKLYWEILGTEDLDEDNIFNVMYKYDPYWSKKDKM